MLILKPEQIYTPDHKEYQKAQALLDQVMPIGDLSQMSDRFGPNSNHGIQLRSLKPESLAIVQWNSGLNNFAVALPGATSRENILRGKKGEYDKHGSSPFFPYHLPLGGVLNHDLEAYYGIVDQYIIRYGGDINNVISRVREMESSKSGYKFEEVKIEDTSEYKLRQIYLEIRPAIIGLIGPYGLENLKK